MAVRTHTRFNRSPLTLALAAAMLLPAGAAMSQEQSGQSDADQNKTEEAGDKAASKTLDTVTVVGSRIKRVEVEGPAPVTIFSREDIDREGFQTVGDMLDAVQRLHLDLNREGRSRPPGRCWMRSACRRTAWVATRTSSPAASVSGSALPGRWCCGPR